MRSIGKKCVCVSCMLWPMVVSDFACSSLDVELVFNSMHCVRAQSVYLPWIYTGAYEREYKMIISSRPTSFPFVFLRNDFFSGWFACVRRSENALKTLSSNNDDDDVFYDVRFVHRKCTDTPRPGALLRVLVCMGESRKIMMSDTLHRSKNGIDE